MSIFVLSLSWVGYISIFHRSVSKKQALRQFELERAEEQLSAKSKLKEELQSEITAAEVNRFYMTP